MKTVLIFILCIFLATVTSAQDYSGISSKADEYLNHLYSLNRFRGNVLIAKNGRIVYHKAFGLANIEDSISNTTKTRFPIASLTKAFTATAVMILAEKKQLDLNDKITRYLTDIPIEWENINIHHLLTHSSGIPDYSEDSLWLATRSCGLSFGESMTLFRNKKLLSSPGTKYNYSNSGYVLLGYIIEKVSGKSYNRFIEEAIIKPLSLSNTFIDDNSMIIPRRARGYLREGLELHNFPYLNMEIGKSAGGIISTTEDLLKWDQSFSTNKLILKSSKDKMFKIHVGDYGYGWHIDSLNNEKRIFHSGGILGYKTNIDRYEDSKTTIIILSNSYDVFINSAVKDLGAIALGKPYKLPQKRKFVVLEDEKLNQYTGIYKTDDGKIFKINKVKSLLTVELNNKVYNLFAETETNFFSDEYDGQIMFTFSGAPGEQKLIYNKKVYAKKQ